MRSKPLEPPPYPVTPVLRGSAGSDDDAVMTERELEAILDRGPFVVQEKLDGINIGVAPGPTPAIRFKKPWLAEMATDAGMRVDRLLHALRRCHPQEGACLYFEWVDPRQLRAPSANGWFLIDVLESHSGKFFAGQHVDRIASRLGVPRPPQLGSVNLGSVTELQRLFGRSEVTRGPREGVILRRERDGHVVERYKFVRAGHYQQNGGPVW